MWLSSNEYDDATAASDAVLLDRVGRRDGVWKHATKTQLAVPVCSRPGMWADMNVQLFSFLVAARRRSTRVARAGGGGGGVSLKLLNLIMMRCHCVLLMILLRRSYVVVC